MINVNNNKIIKGEKSEVGWYQTFIYSNIDIK